MTADQLSAMLRRALERALVDGPVPWDIPRFCYLGALVGNFGVSVQNPATFEDGKAAEEVIVYLLRMLRSREDT